MARVAPAGGETIDELRAAEFARLDALGHVYLDYTGGGLYAASQLRQHQAALEANVFGNPHSNNPTSQAMTDRVEHARAYVLRYFNASPDEYLVVFTPNASGALRLTGEAYPFAAGSRYLLTFDNHNSVNGIREFARRAGAVTSYLPLAGDALRLDPAVVAAELSRPAPGVANLFAFPAQSNFSGVQHPLELIAQAQATGWDVLLDAAAFVPTNRLDLARWHPDLVALSFYKMFGYPTGIGALVMRKTMAARMRRPWFAGGTIQLASVQGDGFYRAAGEAAFEDGTVDYLSIPAVETGLRFIERVGIDTVHERVAALTARMIDGALALRHGNGQPLVRVHGPTTTEARGGTLAFNLLAPDGQAYDIRRIEDLAGERRISLRTGCFCNPGAIESTYGLTAAQLGPFFHRPEGMGFDQLRHDIRQAHGLDIGAIRASVGLASNTADVDSFLAFLADFRDRPASAVGVAAIRATCGAVARDSA